MRAARRYAYNTWVARLGKTPKIREYKDVGQIFNDLRFRKFGQAGMCYQSEFFQFPRYSWPHSQERLLKKRLWRLDQDTVESESKVLGRQSYSKSYETKRRATSYHRLRFDSFWPFWDDFGSISKQAKWEEANDHFLHLRAALDRGQSCFKPWLVSQRQNQENCGAKCVISSTEQDDGDQECALLREQLQTPYLVPSLRESYEKWERWIHFSCLVWASVLGGHEGRIEHQQVLRRVHWKAW